jgi:hypothetical protein
MSMPPALLSSIIRLLSKTLSIFLLMGLNELKGQDLLSKRRCFGKILPSDIHASGV